MDLKSHTLVPVTTAVTHTEIGSAVTGVRPATKFAIPRKQRYTPKFLTIFREAEE